MLGIACVFTITTIANQDSAVPQYNPIHPSVQRTHTPWLQSENTHKQPDCQNIPRKNTGKQIGCVYLQPPWSQARAHDVPSHRVVLYSSPSTTMNAGASNPSSGQSLQPQTIRLRKLQRSQATATMVDCLFYQSGAKSVPHPSVTQAPSCQHSRSQRMINSAYSYDTPSTPSIVRSAIP